MEYKVNQSGFALIIIILAILSFVSVAVAFYLGIRPDLAIFNICPTGSKVGRINAPPGSPLSGEKTCYKVSGFEGKSCKSKRECGIGYCVGEYMSKTHVGGTCQDFVSGGCYNSIDKDGKDFDVCVD